MDLKTINIKEILLPTINPYEIKVINIKANSIQTALRYSKFHLKEPETIKWIDDMSKDSIMLDIGSNVGVYTIASVFKGIKGCIAIDPSMQNCAELQNICTHNNITNVSIWCAALSKHQQISELKVNKIQLEKLQKKANLHNIEITNYAGLGFTPLFLEKVNVKNQLAPPLNINDIYNIKSVGISHIKIDTDGAEFEILGSITNLLGTQELKSILIELRSEYDLGRAKVFFEKYGFKLDDRYEPENLHQHSFNRRSAANIKDRNYIFTKN